MTRWVRRVEDCSEHSTGTWARSASSRMTARGLMGGADAHHRQRQGEVALQALALQGRIQLGQIVHFGVAEQLHPAGHDVAEIPRAGQAGAVHVAHFHLEIAPPWHGDLHAERGGEVVDADFGLLVMLVLLCCAVVGLPRAAASPSGGAASAGGWKWAYTSAAVRLSTPSAWASSSAVAARISSGEGKAASSALRRAGPTPLISSKAEASEALFAGCGGR